METPKKHGHELDNPKQQNVRAESDAYCRHGEAYKTRKYTDRGTSVLTGERQEDRKLRLIDLRLPRHLLVCQLLLSRIQWTDD